MTSGLDFEQKICQQIEERNQIYNKFSTLIISHARLSENNRELHAVNEQLKREIEKLQHENHELSAKASANAPVIDRSDHATVLEQKLYKVQEELTEVHRTKGARAQQIIDLNMALQEKEKELTEITEKLQEKNELLEKMKSQLKDYEQQNTELKEGNVALKDEYQALQITSESVDDKLRKCQLENQTLVERLLQFKDNQAKNLNTENDQIQNVLVGKSLPKVKPVAEGARSSSSAKPVPISPTPSSPPSASVSSTSVSFKDKINNFFGINKAKQEELQQPSFSSSQYFTTVHLPEDVVCRWKAHESDVTAMRFFPSGGNLATGGSDRMINIWNFVGDKARLQSTLRGCNGGVTSIDFDPQEYHLAASSSDYACRIWAVSNQRMRLTLTGHSGSVSTNKFLGSSHRLVSGSKDRTVKVWDVTSGACTRTFMAGSSCHDVVAIDAAESLASGHFDKKIRVWDARIGSHAQNEITVGGRITSLDMPIEKSLLVCCTKDHTLELIDMRKGSVLSVFTHDAFKVASDLMRCSISVDGCYVSVGSSDGTVLSWNVKTGTLSSCAKQHTDPVISCNWTSGRLVSGDKNKNCILWTDSWHKDFVIVDILQELGCEWMTSTYLRMRLNDVSAPFWDFTSFFQYQRFGAGFRVKSWAYEFILKFILIKNSVHPACRLYRRTTTNCSRLKSTSMRSYGHDFTPGVDWTHISKVYPFFITSIWYLLGWHGYPNLYVSCKILKK